MNLHDILDIAVKVAASIVAGLWVLMNYLRGRTHKQRLRLRVSANRVHGDQVEYLTVKTELENVGLVRVEISLHSSLVKTYADRIPEGVGIPWAPEWEELTKSELVERLDPREPPPRHYWVEPSGAITEEILVALPGVSNRHIKVWAHVESDKIAWSASVVVGPKHPAG